MAPVAAPAPALRELYAYLTDGCNLACRHCWLAPQFSPNGSRAAFLPLQVLQTAVHEAKPLGLKRVKLTGGEPLLHPQIEDILAFLQAEDLALNLETNGLLCTAEMAKKIASFPSHAVAVSMDGADAETHEWVRSVSGSYQAARQAVRRLADAGASPQIITSIMRCNIGQVEDIVAMAEELGATSVKFNIVQPTARGAAIHKDVEHVSVAELIALGRKIDTELAPHTPVHLYFDYPLAFRPLSRLANGEALHSCGILGILGLLPSGHVALCGIGQHIPELAYGLVGHDRLADVWQGHPILLDMRKTLPGGLKGVCAQCIMRPQCLGACVAQNYYSSRDLHAPFWFCQQAYEAGLFPASRLQLG